MSKVLIAFVIFGGGFSLINGFGLLSLSVLMLLGAVDIAHFQKFGLDMIQLGGWSALLTCLSASLLLMVPAFSDADVKTK